MEDVGPRIHDKSWIVNRHKESAAGELWSDKSWQTLLPLRCCTLLLSGPIPLILFTLFIYWCNLTKGRWRNAI